MDFPFGRLRIKWFDINRSFRNKLPRRQLIITFSSLLSCILINVSCRCFYRNITHRGELSVCVGSVQRNSTQGMSVWSEVTIFKKNTFSTMFAYILYNHSTRMVQLLYSPSTLCSHHRQQTAHYLSIIRKLSGCRRRIRTSKSIYF